MFFVVQIGAIAATSILLLVFRKEKAKVEVGELTQVTEYFPSVMLVGMIVALIVASFIPNTPHEINGIICMSIMVIGFIYKMIRMKSVSSIVENIKEIDYFTILLLAGLFVVIAGIKEAGIIDEISRLIQSISQGNVFAIFTIVVFVSVLFSAFIDNIPYVATMLPVMGAISLSLGIEPYLLYFGLLIGATLGGNLTPIGASANITGIGILRREGYEVSAKQFMKLGIPFTLAAVLTGYLLIWVLWA